MNENGEWIENFREKKKKKSILVANYFLLATSFNVSTWTVTMWKFKGADVISSCHR